jgi:single-stranded DNA-binding protein
VRAFGLRELTSLTRARTSAAQGSTEYQRKGSLVLVAGRLHGQTWKAQDGSTRRGVVVALESVQFLTRSGQQEK